MPNADFTIQDVLVWARTKPADESYSYGDILNCALCRFLRETGRMVEPMVGGATYGERYGRYDERRNLPAWAGAGLLCAQTFGALVTRLEALIPETPPSQWTKLDAYLVDIEMARA